MSTPTAARHHPPPQRVPQAGARAGDADVRAPAGVDPVSRAAGAAPGPRRGGVPGAAEAAVSPVVVGFGEVLDYFAACERCGYPATATATVYRGHDGAVWTAIHPSCGQPCGWRGRVRRVLGDPAHRAVATTTGSTA
ncbi:hypothetical protein ACTD5D_40515 [Nocardia takedensis]|uniref:hypothetical protein n=1 Tax=Nocardia takedensis TaxID=259390 RepID=UPI003F75C627